MTLRRAVAICAALVVLPGAAGAQEAGLTERLRVQGIYSRQFGLPPPYDFAGQAIPELSYLVLAKRAELRATYTLGATLHTALPADLTNRVLLASTFDLSDRAELLVSAEGAYTSITNALITRPSADVPVAGVPTYTGQQLLTARVTEGTTWETSPVTRVEQTAFLAYGQTIGAALPFDAYYLDSVVSADRAWSRDLLGVDLRAGYARNHAEPLPVTHLVPLALTPHWRRDVSETVSALFVAGATVVLSTDDGTRPQAGPYLQASLYYKREEANVELTGIVGPTPNPLTAQLIYADRVTMRASVPLSTHDHVTASATAGYLHGTIIDLRRGGAKAPDFDTILTDAGVGWSPIETVELFARYQFLDQRTAAPPPGAVAVTADVVRHAVLVGVQLSSRPDPVRVPTSFPNRVDRSDAEAR